MSVCLTQQTKDEVGTLAESFQQTVEHLQKYISYINGLAYRDALTGVKNKTAYQDTESRFEEEMRQGKPEFAVVVLDINGLKKVNDTYGHDFGDMLIISACRLICKTFQHSPVYRIGGDEFAAFVPVPSPECARQKAESLVAALHISYKGGRQITASVGASLAPRDGHDFAALYQKADSALYDVKAQGKDGFKLYE